MYKEDGLYHYGRKGMKWGQHIFSKYDSSGSLKPRAQKRLDNYKKGEAKIAEKYYSKKRDRSINRAINAEIKSLKLDRKYLKKSNLSGAEMDWRDAKNIGRVKGLEKDYDAAKANYKKAKQVYNKLAGTKIKNLDKKAYGYRKQAYQFEQSHQKQLEAIKSLTYEDMMRESRKMGVDTYFKGYGLATRTKLDNRLRK